MSSEYLPFAYGTGAHVLLQEQWATHVDRSRGFQTGIARSEAFNKVWRQASVMTAAIAEFIDMRVPGNVEDNGQVSALATQFAQAVGVAATSGLPDAPADNRWFTRRNADWASTENLPLDGGEW